MKNTIIVGDRKVTITGSRKVLTNKMYGWSKYGGVSLGLVQENVTPEWVCQACGVTQPEELPPFMFEHCPREFIRICGICHHTRRIYRLVTLTELLDAVRRTHDSYS